MPSDPLSNVFSALADPTRRAMLLRLRSGRVAVKDLARPFKMSLPAVSKHLKVLEKSGLIERQRQGQRRPCRLSPKPLKEAVDWLEHYRSLWEQRFDRLEEYLGELQRKEKGDGDGSGS